MSISDKHSFVIFRGNYLGVLSHKTADLAEHERLWRSVQNVCNGWKKNPKNKKMAWM